MDLRRAVDQAIEQYGTGQLPQVVIGSAAAILSILFPPAGVIAAGAQAALAARISKIQAERVQQSQLAVSTKLEKLDEEVLDKSFVETDAFFDWVYEVFDRIRRTEAEEKLDALQNVFVNGLTRGKSTGVLKELVLRRVTDLSPVHIEGIKLVHHLARPPDEGDPESAGRRDPFAREDEIRAALPQLTDAEFEAVRKDLMGMDIALSWAERGTLAYMSSGRGWERLILSPLGEAIRDYVSDPGRGSHL